MRKFRHWHVPRPDARPQKSPQKAPSSARGGGIHISRCRKLEHLTLRRDLVPQHRNPAVKPRRQVHRARRQRERRIQAFARARHRVVPHPPAVLRRVPIPILMRRPRRSRDVARLRSAHAIARRRCFLEVEHRKLKRRYARDPGAHAHRAARAHRLLEGSRAQARTP